MVPALLIYSLDTAAPGPANLSIANLAMSQGRRASFILAGGVVTGSLCWGVLTALGISTRLLREPHFLLALKLAGALYLLWLAKKAIKALSVPPHATSPAPVANYYWQGLRLHLTNPKAILIGLTVTSIGVSTHSTPWTTLLLVMLCAILGIIFSACTPSASLLKRHRASSLVIIDSSIYSVRDFTPWWLSVFWYHSLHDERESSTHPS